MMEAINHLFNAQMHHLTFDDRRNLQIYIAGHAFVLSGAIFSSLEQWYNVTNNVFIVRVIVCSLFIIGGILKCIATAFMTFTFCKHTNDAIFEQDAICYCEMGYISTQILGDLLPVIIASDILLNAIGNIRIRLFTFNFFIFCSTFLWITAYIHYLDESFDISDEQSSHIMQTNLNEELEMYDTAKIGWVFVCIIAGFTSLFMLPACYQVLTYSNNVKRAISTTFAMVLLTGMALSLVGIDIILFEYKFAALIYVGIVSIISFDLLTL